MNSAAFELGEQLDNRKVQFIFHKDLWGGFIYPSLDLRFSKWRKMKYLNSAGSDFNSNIRTIPDNKGGLYLFYIKCEIITGLTEYPLYIGRAQLTAHQNLRKRVKEYFQKYSQDNERAKIFRMFRYWSKELYLAYYPLPNNSTIASVERDIINSLILPMNDLVPDKKIKQAIKAFQK